jgi:hypothetical protein
MFGTFTLKYEPGSMVPGDASVEMSFSAEATIPEFLQHVENFLKANGYILPENSIQYQSEGK